MKIRFLVLSLIVLLSVGCSAFFDMNEVESGRYDDKVPPPSAPADTTTSLEKNEESRDRGEGSSETLMEEPILLDAVDGYGGDDDAVGVEYAPMVDEAEYTESDAAGGSIASAPNQQVTTLKAGEIDDNADWDDYLLYRRESLENFGQLVNDVDVTGRQIITVTDAQGMPILGATVSVLSGATLVSQTQTYANGQTLYLPNAHLDNILLQGNTIITIEKDGVSSTIDMSVVRMAGPNWEFSLDMQPSRDTVKLDVVFLLDATGSMSDEIAQLQNNILSISQQIDDMGDVDVRYGLVHYRDRGDDYVSRVFDFTPDVTAFQSELNRVKADGGGDTPEALNDGLHDALQTVGWRGDNTIKLVFLVADAPPHLDYANDYNYADEMLYAGEQGIKIHPIASSGLDPVGEYIFRQIGQTTMGRFIFLTYSNGTSGSAGDDRTDLEAGEDEYTVDFLDGLVVNLVEDEINAFKGQILK
jgi:hypothetical protein